MLSKAGQDSAHSCFRRHIQGRRGNSSPSEQGQQTGQIRPGARRSGAQKLALLPAGLVVLSLNVSWRGHCRKEGQGLGLRSRIALVTALSPHTLTGLQRAAFKELSLQGFKSSTHSLCDTVTCFPTGPRPLPSGGPASPKRKLEAAEEPPGEELSKRARVAELPAPELPSRDV